LIREFTDLNQISIYRFNCLDQVYDKLISQITVSKGTNHHRLQSMIRKLIYMDNYHLWSLLISVIHSIFDQSKIWKAAGESMI